MIVEAITRKTPEQLHDDDVQRRALEAAARRIEQLRGNELYERAWKRAAAVVREMMILT